MRFTKKLFVVVFLFLVLPLAACGGEDDVVGQSDADLLATMVAETMVAMQPEAQSETQPEETPAESPVEIPEGDMQPLSDTECDHLADLMGRTLELMVSSEIVPVTMSWSGEVGGACQMTALGNGKDFENIFEVELLLEDMLFKELWMGGDMLMPCLGHGGAGPSAEQSCYVDETKVCETMVIHKPMDMALCEGIDGPIGNCMAALSPEQTLFTVTMTCAQGQMAVPLPKTEAERIEFDTGATSAAISGTLPPQSMHPYVLTAMEGQEMTIVLHKNENSAATLTIWGADGTVLISDHASASSWVGMLPSTQDYYIDIISQDAGIFEYTLDIILPPVSTIAGTQVFPQTEPFEFGMMQSLVAHGVPLILPPDFPVSGDLPAVVPHVFSAGQDFLEVSLDYGVECQGTGACHYGSFVGSRVDGSVPTGTEYFPFDIDQARVVSLPKGISGYFVESLCGANCSDAQIFWVYGGYQYMLGFKAAAESDVVALASSAILNSVP